MGPTSGSELVHGLITPHSVFPEFRMPMSPLSKNKDGCIRVIALTPEFPLMLNFIY